MIIAVLRMVPSATAFSIGHDSRWAVSSIAMMTPRAADSVGVASPP